MREVERGRMLEDRTGVQLQSETCSAHDKDDVIHGFVSQSVDGVEGLGWWAAGILAEGGL